MGWPNPPYPFGNAVSPEQMQYLDLMFNQAASMMSVPCSASGTNAISLTPLVNCPNLSAYSELGGYRFKAIGNSTGPVTAQYNGLGFLNVYHADGLTQCSTGDFISGQQYVLTYSLALNGGAGGFFQESPSNPVTQNVFGPPGGRLTLQSATPVMFTNQLAQQTIYYAPYNSPFVPIYNGSTIQPYQFTSSLSDQVGLSLALAGSANWAANTNYDLYVTLNGGVPVLCTGPAWTNNTTRAVTNSIFGGLLTNTGAITARISAVSTIPVSANQATFLGTVQMSAAGQTQWQYGGAGNGGVAAFFNLANYYNPVPIVTQVSDTTGPYSYTLGTVRQAHASAGNQINFVQCSSERAVHASYIVDGLTIAANGAQIQAGIGVNTTTSFAELIRFYNPQGANINFLRTCLSYDFTFTGYGFFSANESSDGINANVFNQTALNHLDGTIWL